jgi:HAD superfamily hydrolase (TIGR01549 family)
MMLRDDTRFVAWLIDLDGTLYAPFPVKLAMGTELLLGGWRATPILRRFRKQHEEVRARPEDTQDDPFRAQLEMTAQRLGVEVDVVEARVRHWMIERPGKWLRLFRRRQLLERISSFRDAGGRTALVSDYPARQKLASLGAEGLFDVVVAAGEPGGPRRLKPDPEGYLRAAALLQVKPEQCLVVGDRPDADGRAAKAAGMQFRWIK